MRSRLLPLVVLMASAVVLLLARPASTAPPPAPPDPSCSPAPSDCGAWHTGDVTVTWSGPPAGVSSSGCGPTTISTDTSGTPVSCTWSNGDGSRTTTVTVRRDSTQPSAKADASRGPDVNGWYNHPLSVTYTATDATSGLASCSSASTYGGPDSSHARVQGECKDQAGNWSNPYYVFKYDSTPPSVNWIKAGPAGRGVLLTWGASKDALRFEVVRQPGLQGSATSTIYSGDGRSVTDRRARRGVAYHYAITAYDEAGNAKLKIIVAVPGRSVTVGSPSRSAGKSAPAQPALLGPREGARVAAPPRLRWREASGATYYNVQLFRNGKKVLSAWPSGHSLRLRRSWTYAGHRYSLRPGRYRWYVWPGHGPRSANRYGKLIGTRSFVVTR